MRYIVRGNVEVRSENAAKPSQQTSKHTLAFLKSLGHVDASLDFGCGKARYARAISARSDTTFLLDSDIQLFREQWVHGKKTSVADFYRSSNDTRITTHATKSALVGSLDRVHCLNVLSAVPSYAARQSILSDIRSLLRRGGEAVFALQYRNSDFTRMSKLPNAEAYLDGFLVNSLRGWSFYGLIRPERLRRLVRKHGLVPTHETLRDGTVFMRAIAA